MRREVSWLLLCLGCSSSPGHSGDASSGGSAGAPPTLTSDTGGNSDAGGTSNAVGSTESTSDAGGTSTSTGGASNTGNAGPGGTGSVTSGATSGGTGGTSACPCELEGSCYEVGAVHPSNPCLVCEGATELAWLPAEGAACDDGVFCNGVDSCSDGECGKHDDAPCGDDALFCNGAESCDEVAEACTHSGDPCADDALFCNGAESCDEAANACAHSGNPCGDDGIFCNGTESCDEDGNSCPHSGNPCGDNGAYCDGPEVCVEDESQCASEGYPCADLACIERPGPSCCEAGVDCRCVLHVNQATGSDSAGGTTWGTALETIGEALTRAAQHKCEVWVATGTYTPGPDRDDTLEIPPGVALYGGFGGDEELASERAPEAFPTVISGERGDPEDATDNTRRLLTSGDGTKLDGFTVEGAYDDLDWEEDISAAALTVVDAKMSISNCVFRDNRSVDNIAAIGAQRSELEIRSCQFINNNARPPYVDLDHLGSVAAVGLSESKGVIDQSEFIGNIGASHTASGVSFWLSGGGAITNCLFQDNVSSAVTFNSVDPLTISNSRFVGNVHTPDYGAAFNGNGEDSSYADVLINSCLFESNHSWDGAVAWRSPRKLTVLNSVFLNNIGRAQGAGLYTSGPLSLVNSSFSGNKAELEFGGELIGSGLLARGNATAVDVKNSVFWDDESPQIGVETSGGTPPTVTVSYSNVRGGYAGVGNVDADPLWDANLRPTAASPLIDAAHPSEFPEFDIDGNPRFDDPSLDGSVADMGAYEYQGVD